ncbi:MAG: hypothetical protein AAGC49_06755 [Brevundimonas sp.]
MTDSDDAPTPAPFPDHVIEGNVHDPVVETAPQADPGQDEKDAAGQFLSSEGTAILPVTGTQTGVVIPPPAGH